MDDATAQRIAQFRKMATDDPDNELGHFSLGRALMEVGEHAEAVASFDRALAIKGDLSKAYQFKAESLLADEQKDAAIAALQAGAVTAAERGDVLPKNAMIAKLEELGAEVPEAARTATGPKVDVGEGQVFDIRTGEVGQQLARAPFRNRLGQLIHQHISQESWQEWIGMGTKVINELRLPLSDPKAQDVFDQHMVEFLNLRDTLDADEQYQQEQAAKKAKS
ncbi:MAG: Fe(2+)-trafficking protein [Planctomycetota bacterium]